MTIRTCSMNINSSFLSRTASIFMRCISWDVAPCSLEEIYRCFGGKCFLHIWGEISQATVKTESGPTRIWVVYSSTATVNRTSNVIQLPSVGRLITQHSHIRKGWNHEGQAALFPVLPHEVEEPKHVHVLFLLVRLTLHLKMEAGCSPETWVTYARRHGSNITFSFTLPL